MLAKCRHALKLLFIAALSFSLAGCLLPAEEEALPPPLVKPPKENYRTVEVRKGEIAKEIKGPGHLESYSWESARFAAEGGRLQKMLVNQGDMVRRGDVLVQLDVGDMDIQLKQQELNMIRSRQSLRIALANQDEDAMTIARLQYELDKAKYDRLLSTYGSRQLVAGIDGQVTFAAELEEGRYVAPYETLVMISDPGKLRIVFMPGASPDVGLVSVGQEVKVTLRNKTVITGRVAQTPSSAPATEDPVLKERYSKLIYVSADGLPQDAQMGDSVEISVYLQHKQDALIIPRSGLRSYMGRNFVRILEDGDKLREIDVEPGLASSTEVEITAGLKEGMLVVLP